jgi:hypothetical protein
MAACRPRRARAAPGATVLSAGINIITAAPAATTTAASQALPVGPAPPPDTSSRASRTPNTPPAAAAITHSGMASAAVNRTSCQRFAPRAVSMADSPSRWPASSRAAASRAAAASRNSSTAQMASSERATSRSLAIPSSTAGRLVMSVRDGSCWALASVDRRPFTLAATAVSWSAGMLSVCGSASQVP